MLGFYTNGYKLWNPEENEILYGRDIVFNEEKFEFEPTYVETTVPLDEEIEKSEPKETEKQNLILSLKIRNKHIEKKQIEVNDKETESDLKQLRRSMREIKRTLIFNRLLCLNITS